MRHVYRGSFFTLRDRQVKQAFGKLHPKVREEHGDGVVRIIRDDSGDSLIPSPVRILNTLGRPKAVHVTVEDGVLTLRPYPFKGKAGQEEEVLLPYQTAYVPEGGAGLDEIAEAISDRYESE